MDKHNQYMIIKHGPVGLSKLYSRSGKYMDKHNQYMIIKHGPVGLSKVYSRLRKYTTSKSAKSETLKPFCFYFCTGT